MTKDSQSTPHEPERMEEIVSYLDGELSGEESARVEQRLAADEGFRQELQSIERAWAALDELPLTTVEDRFAKTTMELVVQSARSDVEQKTLALPIQKRNRTLRNLFMIATAGLLGCLVFRASWQNPNRQLLADLAVIENVEVYTQFREVDFLRQLNRRIKSKAWPTDSDPLAVQSSNRVDSLESPEEWLENLAEEERLSLRAKTNRFRALSAEQQDRLRELQMELHADKDTEQLQQTMLRYQDWLSDLPASEQYELRELSAEPRVKRIMRMLRQDATRKSLELTAEELKALFEVVTPRIEEMRKKILSQMSGKEKERFEGLAGHEKRRQLMDRMMRISRRDGEQFQRMLQEAIPEEKLKAFEKLSSEEKRRRFGGWMWEAYEQEGAGRRRPARRNMAEPSEQELEKYFSEELDAATIERLLALPREKMQQKLERRVQGGISRRDWERPHDRDYGPPGRHYGPPRPGEGRRGDRPGLHDRRPGSPEGRPGKRPPFRPEGRGRDRRSLPEDVPSEDV